MILKGLTLDRHLVIVGKTRSGKTTLMKDLFFRKDTDSSGDTVFKVFINPDPMVIRLSSLMDVPVVSDADDVIVSYLEQSSSRIVLEMPPYMDDSIMDQISYLVERIANIKYELHMRGLSTHSFVVFIDEAQTGMTKQRMHRSIEWIFTQGIKYGIVGVVATQRLQLINNTAISQADVLVGYISTFDRKYMRERELASFAEEPFTFIDPSGKVYMSRKTTLKEYMRKLN